MDQELNLPSQYLEIFELIEKAGGVDNVYKSNGQLTNQERNKILSNNWAFFFTIFFYWKHKMWKKSITLYVIAIVFLYILFYILYELIGIQETNTTNLAINLVGSGVLFRYNANIDLYKRYKLNQNNWW